MRTVLVMGIVAACVVASGSSPVHAQPAATGMAPAPGDVEVEPIHCWWKADRPAVRIGERFGLSLTCRVVETATVTVVPTLTQIDPGALQVTPFDVVGGTRGEDVLAAPWRYVQYDYTVRLLGEGFIGQDIDIPGISITYNIRDTRTGSDGRDLTYLLPSLPVRVISLVPRAAADIRDTASGTWADVETRRFRANAASVAAATFAGLAVVTLVFATVRLFGARRGVPRVAVVAASPHAILGGCLRGLRAARQVASRDGWSPATARRALAPVRIAAAVALRQPIATAPVDRRGEPREGQLVVSTGWLRRKASMVSAAQTPARVAHEAATNRRLGAAARGSAQALADALEALTRVGYGREGEEEVDGSELNTSLDRAERTIRDLRLRRLWPLQA